MSLTPADVRNKQFRVVLRGYHIAAVDAFLDEIEGELTRLSDRAAHASATTPGELDAVATGRANGQHVAAGTNGHGRHAAAAGPGSDSVPSAADAGHASPDPGRGAEVATTTRPTAEVTDLRPASPGGAGHDATRASAGHDGDADLVRAVRTLRLAEQTADQVVAVATAEADQVRAAASDTSGRIVAQAQSEAAALLAQARAEADQVLADSRAHAGQVEAELAQRRDREVGDLTQRAADLRAEIDQLTHLERSYRADLKRLLDDNLRLLDRRSGTVDS